MYRKIITTGLVALFNLLCATSQLRTVSGVLTDANGDPLPGVSIVIKGNNTGTITGVDGFYSIDAPVGSTLVFSYVGFLSEEMQVTADTPSTPGNAGDTQIPVTPVNRTRLFRSADLQGNSKGIASLDQTSEKDRIRLRKKLNGNYYSISSGSRWHLKGSVMASLSADIPANTPDIQDAYAQGRSINGFSTYRGPETGEIFSWGPPVKNLEYDGGDDPYDIRGRLVPKGTGNGNPALNYNSFRVLQPGYAATQDVRLITGNNKSNFSAGYNHSSFSGTIPGSGMQKHDFSFRAEQRIFRFLKTDLSVQYLYADASLMNGFSQSRIYSMAARSPLTFDIANGLNNADAVVNPQAYLLPGNAQRSFAAGNSDNPYWLVNTIRDREINEKILTALKLNANPMNDLNVYLDASANIQGVTNHSACKEGTVGIENGMLSDRSEDYNTLFALAGVNYHKYFRNQEWNSTLNYQVNYLERQLNHAYGSEPESPDPAWESTTSRLGRQLVIKENYSFRNAFMADFSLSAYNSTTLNKLYWLPSAGLGIRITELTGSGFLSNWKILGSWSRSIAEAPMQYQRGMMNSTLYRADEFDRYAESEEIVNRNMAGPEKLQNFELGTEIGLNYNRLQISAFYYWKSKHDFIYPVYLTGPGFTPLNTANLLTAGYDIDIDYILYNRDNIRWYLAVNFHRYSTTVEKMIYSDEVKLGGFSDVSSCMTEGETYGVIKGSAYLRDANGAMVIGVNGFPLIDPRQKIIGDPNPDWIMGIENTLKIRGFSMNLLFDIRVGGDVWNGTSNTLNYLGLGAATEQERLTRDYIFPGVKQDGSVNNIPVNFYDPGLPVNENRWIRYGYTGVAEDAIEDGSFIRLKEFRLKYSIPLRNLPYGKGMQLSLFAMNLFQISGYSGADPQNMMLAFSHNLGFDYFNLPSVRTLGASIKIDF
jgi:hypothetical protein